MTPTDEPSAELTITFLDAWQLVAPWRAQPRVDAPALTLMLQASQHPQATDGAQKILNHFLRGYSQRAQHERIVGQSVIGLRHNKRRVRLAVAAPLRLKLPLMAAQPCTWCLESPDLTPDLARLDMAQNRLEMYLIIIFFRPGRMRLCFVRKTEAHLKQPTAPAKTRHAPRYSAQNDCFELDVIVESDEEGAILGVGRQGA